jgi:hypothetical protein
VEDPRHQRRPLNELFRARLTRFLIGGERLFETRLRRETTREGAYRKDRISGWLAGPVPVWWNVTEKNERLTYRHREQPSRSAPGLPLTRFCSVTPLMTYSPNPRR